MSVNKNIFKYILTNKYMYLYVIAQGGIQNK